MSQSSLVSLGARIPLDLKKHVDEYCERHGIKMRFFVVQALKEKLMEVEQIAYENQEIDRRLITPQFTSEQDFKKYLASRRPKK